jgi:hypothetical protein
MLCVHNDLFGSQSIVPFVFVVTGFQFRLSRSSLSINAPFAGFCRLQAIDIRPELHDFAEQVRGFLLPVRHCFLSIGVAWSKLRYVSVEFNGGWTRVIDLQQEA